MTAAAKPKEVRCDMMIYKRAEPQVCNKFLAEVVDGVLWVHCERCNAKHPFTLKGQASEV